MCRPASFVLTKDKVLWLPGTNSHEEIIEQYKLNDRTNKPDFVRIEIAPPTNNYIPQYDAPLSRWIYKIGQDYLPPWYVPEVDEKRAREELPAWYGAHIIGQNTDVSYIKQIGENGCYQKAGNNSKQKAGNDSIQVAKFVSIQIAGNNSTQFASIYSTQKAKCHSIQKASCFSKQKAGSYSTQEACGNSYQQAGNRSIQIADNNSTQKAGFGSTQEAGHNSNQKAGNKSIQRAGNGSIQEAGTDTIQMGWWYKGGKIKVVSRIVTKEMAGKRYRFFEGKWTEVKQ